MFTSTRKPRPPAGGRLPQRTPISHAEAKRRARTWLHTPPSEHLTRTWQLLCTAGVLTVAQLGALAGVAPRTLRKYCSWHLLDRLPDRAEQLRGLGFEGEASDLLLYCLGEVGLAMTEECSILVPRGYVGPKDRVTHDLLANETILRLAKEAEARGWTWQWASRYEATLYRSKKPVIEPDGMLVLRHPERGQRVALLEMHNEDSARRVAKKIDHYETNLGLRPDSLDPWLGEDHPFVLALARHKCVLEGYVAEIAAREKRGHLWRCHWLGKGLPGLMEKGQPSHWLHYRAGKVIDLLG